jgi:hypothetical protein
MFTRIQQRRLNAVDWGLLCPSVKTLAIIAASLIYFVLSVPHAALAQGPDEASALNQQVIQLYNQRH